MILFFAVGLCFSEPGENFQADFVQQDDFQRVSVVPVLGYTEETEFQYGFMALLFLKPEELKGKVPEIGVTAYASTRDQWQVSLEPYFYLYKDQVSIWSLLRYQDWVASYFGIGNSPDVDEYVNYDRERLEFSFKVESKIFFSNGFKYGIQGHFEHTDIEFDSTEVMELPDDHSGWRNGLGYLIGYDTRDNTNWTKHGVLIQWEQLFYSNELGDYSFDVEVLDIRGYSEALFNTTLAVGFLWQRAEGDVPFDMLSGPDGVKRFRGVENLYFGDNQAVIMQAEIRRYFGYRLGGHLFFEGGKSGGYYSELMRNDWHESIGIGVLLGLNLKENLFARADFSWVDFDHLGMSFYVRQAF